MKLGYFPLQDESVVFRPRIAAQASVFPAVFDDESPLVVAINDDLDISL